MESPIRSEILRALDDWALAVEEKDPATAERVWDVGFRAGPPTELATKLRDPAVRGDPTRLNKLIERADDVAVSVPATLFVAALFERRKGDARVLLEVAQARHPTDFDVTFALAMFHHTRASQRLPVEQVEYHKRQAISHYRTARAIRPDHPAVLTNVGLLLGEKREFGAAAAVLREAIKFHPDDHIAHFNLGGVLVEMNELEEAEAAYRATIRLSPKYGAAYSNLGAVLGRRKRHREAADVLAKAVELAPNEPVIRANYGLALQRTGDLDGALREYRVAVRLDPKYAPGHLNMGVVLELRRDFAGAEKAFREAARLDEKQYAPALNEFLKRHAPDE
jgi:tetratricopeptide (TPR) repeat protein